MSSSISPPDGYPLSVSLFEPIFRWWKEAEKKMKDASVVLDT
jgi:hypothetical protein